jgi:1,4-alpha-glucan branching enzyme
LLGDPLHAGMQRLVRDLNHLYRSTLALHQRDFEPAGFDWIDHQDAERSILSFIRYGADQHSCIVVICNFTPAPWRAYRLGVPFAGQYRECLNTDSHHYGGSNVGTPLGVADAQHSGSHGKPWSVLLDLPPLATVMLEWKP